MFTNVTFHDYLRFLKKIYLLHTLHIFMDSNSPSNTLYYFDLIISLASSSCRTLLLTQNHCSSPVRTVRTEQTGPALSKPAASENVSQKFRFRQLSSNPFSQLYLGVYTVVWLYVFMTPWPYWPEICILCIFILDCFVIRSFRQKAS